MIIGCINCNKKFDIKSDLIPDNGRLLECSSCNHQWFFKKDVELNIEKPTIYENIKNSEVLSPSAFNNEDNFQKKEISKDKNNFDTQQKPKNFINVEKKLKKKSRLLNFILIFIISFAALIVLIDTFKGPISNIIPNIEFILYNLYESFKDIILFFKDLI